MKWCWGAGFCVLERSCSGQGQGQVTSCSRRAAPAYWEEDGQEPPAAMPGGARTRLATDCLSHQCRSDSRGCAKQACSLDNMASQTASQTDSQQRPAMQHIVFFHPDLGIGGAERLVVDAAVGLQERGHQVTIYTSHCDPAHCFDEARDGELPPKCCSPGLCRAPAGS